MDFEIVALRTSTEAGRPNEENRVGEAGGFHRELRRNSQ